MGVGAEEHMVRGIDDAQGLPPPLLGRLGVCDSVLRRVKKTAPTFTKHVPRLSLLHVFLPPCGTC